MGKTVSSLLPGCFSAVAFIIAGNDDMHKSWIEFEFQPYWTTDCLHFFSAVLDRILFILAGNDNIHKSLDEFEILLDPTTGFHGNRKGLKMNFTLFLLLFI